MNSGVGESSLCGRFLWTPTVDSCTDVTSMSASSISFYHFLSLLKPCLSSEFYSRTLRLKFMHLHCISFQLIKKNGILGNDVSLMIDRLMNKSGFSINGSLYCSNILSFY